MAYQVSFHDGGTRFSVTLTAAQALAHIRRYGDGHVCNRFVLLARWPMPFLRSRPSVVWHLPIGRSGHVGTSPL